MRAAIKQPSNSHKQPRDSHAPATQPLNSHKKSRHSHAPASDSIQAALKPAMPRRARAYKTARAR
eukprot:8481198-Lingulodinium_polyedra.AAC.1